MLRMQMLGQLSVELDGVPVAPPESRRAWSLLAWLALNPGPHPRSVLAARFWPDVLDTSARASLRTAIWSLRQALGPDSGRWLTASRDHVGLAPGELWTDVAEFGRLLDAGHVESALELCGGDLLAGLDDEWVYEAREEHRDRLAAALGTLAAEEERRGDLAAAVVATRRQLQFAPFTEHVHADLIRRLAASGDRAAAMLAYRRLRDRFRDELGLEPSVGTRRLAASLRAAEPPAGRVKPAGRPSGDGSSGVRGLPLVGRTESMALLEEAWRTARTGHGGVVHLSGEAGIGKTRLVEELAARARDEGALPATCAAVDLSGSAPFALWAELLREVYRNLRPPRLEASRATILARLLPDLAPRLGVAAPSLEIASPDLERTLLFEGIVELVEWACRDRPLFVVMEDVHLADAPSLQLVGYVARRIRTLPLLVVLTRRELPRRTDADALQDTLRSRGVLLQEIQLSPLPDDEIASLVRTVAVLPDAEVDHVVAASDGNPFLALESARARGRAETTPPASLRGNVRAVFGGLGPDARLLAEFAAVAARPLEREEREALPLDRGTEAATAAVESGLLVADASRVEYRHALLREAVYADMSAPRRAWLHETFAAALQSCEARRTRRRAAEVARHQRLAGRDELAVGHLVRAAADARAVAALPEAAEFLIEAAGIAPEDDRLLLDLSEIQAWLGRRAEADEAFDRAVGLIPTGDSDRLADAWLRRGRWLRGALCAPRAARDAYRAARAALGPTSAPAPEALGEVLAGLAWAEAVAGDLDAVEPLLEQLSRTRPPSTDADAHAHAYEIGAARAFCLIRAGRFRESYEPAIAAGEAAQAAGRPDMAYGCWANAASAAACAGDFLRALEFTDQGLAVVHRVLPTGELHLLAARAHILTRLGRFDEAAAAVDAERQLADRLDRPELVATAQHDAGMVAFASGDPGRAAELLATALAAGAPVSRPRARLVRAEALVSVRRLEEAEQELRETALEPVTESDFPHTLVPRLTRVQGLLAAARGDRVLARKRLGEAADAWRRYSSAAQGHGEEYVVNLADLGRPPVEGLIEPLRELDRLLDEIKSLDSEVETA